MRGRKKALIGQSLQGAAHCRAATFAVVAAVLATFPTPSAGAAEQPWAVRTWHTDDDSNDIINGIAQSSDGYLWIATTAGLNQFDGVQFTHHALAERIGVPHAAVRALAPSKSGGFWAAMDGAVVYFAPGAAPRVVRDKIPQLAFDSLTEGNDGSLWIAYHAGPVVQVTTAGAVTVYDSDAGISRNASASALAVDLHGDVWFARGTHLGVIRGGGFIDLLTLPGPISIARASAGGLWLCASFTLYKFDEGSEPAVVATLPLTRGSALPAKPFEDRHGAVWVGTLAGGLFRLTGSALEHVPTPQAKITCLAEDREGYLWVGTDVGFNRLAPRIIDVEGAAAGLPLGAARSICQAKDGRMWAAMADGTVMVRQDERWTAPPFDVSGDAYRIAADPNGAIWIGTRNRRLQRWEGGTLTTWENADGFLGHTVAALVPTAGNGLWIGSMLNDRLQCYRDGKFIDYVIPAGLTRISAMAQDGRGQTWVGFMGNGSSGLLRIAGDEVSDETPRVGAEPVLAIFAGPDDSVWLGRRSRGLGRLKGKRYDTVPLERGPELDSIAQIVADDRGWLWFGSDHGIFKARLSDLADAADGKIAHVETIHFGSDEGLPPLQARTGVTPSAVHGSDGRVWLAMTTALAIAHPERSREPLPPPPVHIRRAVADDQPIAFPAGGVIQADLPTDPHGDAPPAEATLPPDYHHLEFDFTAPTFSAPESARFRYKLEGLDEEWSETTGPRHALYPRLPAGRYRFRVIACNADGVWNEKGAELSFVVTPFVWQTWWFRGLMVVAFGGLALVLVRYAAFRRLRRQLEVLEQRSALDRERARIARDIHDDLGHGLTQIVLLTEMAAHDPASAGDAQANLQQIVTTARQGIRSLDETVWAINPRNDTLPDLVDYLGNFVMQSLQAADIRCRLNLPDHPPDRPVPSEVRHNLFLVVKEAVNNILRHAHASLVTLSVTTDDAALGIVIEDNGAGFTPGAGGPGPGQDGLLNMRQRMTDLGGTIDIQSKPGAGTRIALRYVWGARKGSSQ